MHDTLSAYKTQPQAAHRSGMVGARMIFAGLLILALLVRLVNIQYNSLFLDEAIYVTVGIEALNQIYDQDATSWMFGSYLYPMTTALADMVGGEFGVRLFSVILNVIAAACVFLASRRLFSHSTALAALFLFAFNGPSISLAQLAVYDGMSVTFLALALYLGVCAAIHEEGPHARRLWIATGIAFTLSILAKYISLFYAPALYGTIFAIRLRRVGSLPQFIREMEWVYPIIPLILIFGTYAVTNAADLRLVFSGQFASQVIERIDVIKAVIREMGIISLLAIFGMIVFIVFEVRHSPYKSVAIRLLQVVLMMGLFVSFWMLPIYHVFTANARALYKHEVFALVFLCPLGAYGITFVIQNWGLRRSGAYKPWTLLFRAALLVGVVTVFWVESQRGLSQQDEFQYSWPNVEGVVSYLKTQEITEETNILGSAAAIYEYYMAMPPAVTRAIWTNIWYVNFFGLEGTEAILTALESCQFDMIITDNYYATDIDHTINEAVQSNPHYELVYSDTQTLRIDAIITTKVFHLKEDQPCVSDQPTGTTPLEGL